MRAFCCLLLLALMPVANVSAAEKATSSPLEPYLKKDVFGTIRISPTGEFLAVTVPLEDRTSLVILRRSDLSKTGHVAFLENTHVDDFMWVSATRVLFSITEKFGELQRPQGTGELYGVNADGSGQGPALIGARSEDKGSRWVGAYIIDDLRDDDDSVLISVSAEDGFTKVDRMNVKTGRHTTVSTVPVQRAQFVTDRSAVVRFAMGANADNRTKTYYRANDKADWELFNDESVTDRAVIPRGFSADGKTAYLQIEETSGPDGLYAFDTATRERKLLLRDEFADPSGFHYSPLDDSLYAVTFNGGVPHTEYLDPANPYAKQLRGMQAGLSGQDIIPLNFTKDGNLGLYYAYADRVPGDFYLFDRASNKVNYVASKNAWFKPEMLNPMREVSLKSRDGLTLHGFLTLPKGSSGKNMPLIINPHGGPIGVHDEWGYDPDVQILASHGYAVLQVNYRGSSNYGRAFEKAGFLQWGGKMQDDLTDTTRWAIDQGIADAKRICIYGGSYGGYASLMGVVKEPDLYQCAIGNVGVYDMNAMFHTGDIKGRLSGRNYLRESIGTENLEAISPNRQAARIKVPVMLAAGRRDDRAPASHTEMMRDALLAAGKSVETTLYTGEGHGSYLIKNRIDFYTKLLAFLDKHIGANANASTAAPSGQ